MLSKPGHAQYLAIAGLTIQLDTTHPEVTAIIGQRYRLFFGSQSETRLRCVLQWNPSINDQVNSEQPVTFTPAGLRFDGPVASGWIDLQAGEAVLSCRTTLLEGVIEYFLRLVFALLVFESGGLMLHGAGVIRAGLAVVFFGRSGSGKTTIARLSGVENVLNDDLLLLIPSAHGWQVAATPFWNPSQVRPSMRQANLGGLFRLVQDKRVFLQPASPAVALAELVSAMPILNADAGRMPVILDRLAKLHAGCPVQFLHFLPDDSFWKTVEPALRA